MSTKIRFFTLFVCLVISRMSFANDENGIFPYDHARDQQAVERLLADNYHDIISNTVCDRPTEEIKKKYGQVTTKYFDVESKELKKTYKVLVARKNGQTVGYIQYAVIPRWIFPGDPIKGSIEQLAVDKQYRGQQLGEQLCQKALDEFAEHKLRFAEVLTTTEEVGERFYKNKLGFHYYGQMGKFARTYFWRKYLGSNMSWSDFVKKSIIKCMIRK